MIAILFNYTSKIYFFIYNSTFYPVEKFRLATRYHTVLSFKRLGCRNYSTWVYIFLGAEIPIRSKVFSKIILDAKTKDNLA